MMGVNIDNTQYFKTKPEIEIQVKEVLDLVYNAIDELVEELLTEYIRNRSWER